jgi:hypothetical protein
LRKINYFLHFFLKTPHKHDSKNDLLKIPTAAKKCKRFLSADYSPLIRKRRTAQITAHRLQIGASGNGTPAVSCPLSAEGQRLTVVSFKLQAGATIPGRPQIS